MENTKTAWAIVIGTTAIAAAIYFGLTEERREFMDACIPNMVQSGMEYKQANYVCTVQFSAK